MNWLAMKLVFMAIPTQPMPFFVRPTARQLCATVQAKLIDPNLAAALAFIEAHLGNHAWFAGEQISIADYQMSFAVEAALARSAGAAATPGWPPTRPAWWRAPPASAHWPRAGRW